MDAVFRVIFRRCSAITSKRTARLSESAFIEMSR
jgi:hypothetical protein